ncbi:MAG: hypothetical protein EXS36_03925 [Pedosphaera sp.]|nr:hypothetical protein [Pedosphaera sp.]
MSLADGDQILLTRAAFDNARQVLKGEELGGVNELQWLNHGAYVLKGVEEPLEICEVGEAGMASLKPPTDATKAQRKVSADGEPVLGWRPALDQRVPNMQWVLEKKLGEGGFREVWLGRHQTMKERRVFKFCFLADRVRSLKREMTLFRLIKERIGDHPNIVAIREVYFEEPPFYVVMDHVDGQDLKAWCEQQGGAGKVALETKLEIVAQIADALQSAHDAGVIHRDVKPGNILVGQESRLSHSSPTQNATDTSAIDVAVPLPTLQSAIGATSVLRAKLTDFGIGQVVSAEALKGVTKAAFTETLVASSSSSQTGSQMYMAPELLAGKPASTRSDIYSLGVVLYQLLAGDCSKPVTTDWAADIADGLLRDDLQHCFAGNPQDRFAGAGQLAKNLRALQDRQAAIAKQQAELAAREKAAFRRGMIRTASFALLIVTGVMFLALYAFKQADRADRNAASASRHAQQTEQQRQRAEDSAKALRKSLYLADMGAVQQALQENNLGRALDKLNEYFKPEKRPARAGIALSLEALSGRRDVHASLQ